MITITRPLPPELMADTFAALREKLFFVSDDIRDITFTDDRRLHIVVANSGVNGVNGAGGATDDAASVSNRIDRLVQRFADHQSMRAERVLHEEPGLPGARVADLTDRLLSAGAIVELGHGQFATTGVVLGLLDYFDRSIQSIGVELGAEEYRYPAIIPIRAMQRVRYLASRPECLNFISHLREDIDIIDGFSAEAANITDRVELGGRVETECMNPVAVCLHTFHQLQDRALGAETILVGAAGKCMRYESKTMESLRRLRDFTMREVVCVGTRDSVQARRAQLFSLAKGRLAEWGLRTTVSTASDMFFTSEFAGQSAFQKTFDLKYELRAHLATDDDTLAIGSLNDHRDFIGKGFCIHAGDGDAGAPAAHSCCLAYGLERCVFAFLTQHGLDRRHWPDAVAQGVSRCRP